MPDILPVAFFGEYFRGKNPTTQILVWTLPDKISTWFDDPGAALNWALSEENREKNVYFGTCTRARAMGAHRRGIIADCIEAFALWADIDVAGDGHKGKKYPPDIPTALALLDELDMPASAVVSTGGGLHVYWFLDTPRTADGTASFVYGWQQNIREVARQIGGWEIDATHDLPRILRVPGTWNVKMNPPAPVEVLRLTDDRYTLAEFSEFARPLPAAAPVAAVKDGGTALIFDPLHRAPLVDKLDLAKDTNPTFRTLWERKRRDQIDTTPSGWDMSLALCAIGMEWGEQDVLDLLCAFRRRHGEQQKAQDYYLRTIAKARNGATPEASHEALREFVEERQEEGRETPVPSDRRAEIRAHLARVLEINIEHLWKEMGDPPSYRLVLDYVSIKFAGVDDILSQAKFRAHIASATNKVLRDFTRQQWSTHSQSLLDICEERDIGAEATDTGSVAAWLAEYLEDRPPRDATPEALRTRVSYQRDGRVYIFLSGHGGLLLWLFSRYQERIGLRAAGALLRNFGAEPIIIAVGKPGGTGNTTTTAWRLPEGFGAG